MRGTSAPPKTAGVAIDAAIDPGAETVAGDRDRLEQALQNLAANALRYAPGGSCRPPAGAERRCVVALLVSDEGPGIPAEHLPHMFDRFYKVDESRAAQLGAAGSGLGLSIVKAIVERHGARISVTSRPGRTVFEIWNSEEARTQRSEVRFGNSNFSF